jgi:serine/threonine protein kinase
MRICPSCLAKGDFKICPKDGFPTVELTEIEVSSEDPLLGQVFNEKYKVTRLLGRGGMGSVYEALNIVMDQNVALKLMRKEIAGDLKVVKRFIQEARVVSKLSHPNTIKVFDFGHSPEGYLFIAMEFLRGKPLSDVISDQGRIEPQRTIKIISQLLKSLGEAHKNRIIHRDLKPQNIFLCDIYGEKDFVKVLDFGIAKSAQEDSGTMNITSAGQLLGTPYYVSPEQAAGKTVDHRTDLYAIGIIIYEMLTGSPPFTGTSIPSILLKHVSEEIPLLQEVIPEINIPSELNAVMTKLLRKNPDERPYSCEETLAMLSGISIEQGVQESARVRTQAGEVPKQKIPATQGVGISRFESDAAAETKIAAPGISTPAPVSTAAPISTAAPMGTETPATAFEIPETPVVGNWFSRKPVSFKIMSGMSTALILGIAIALILNMMQPEDSENLTGKQKEENVTDIVAGVQAEETKTPEAQVIQAAAMPAEEKKPLEEKKPAEALLPKKINISIDTTPEGAEILADGNRMGVAPLRFELPLQTGRTAVIRALKKNFEDYEDKIPLDRDSKLVLILKEKQVKKPASVPSAPASTRKKEPEKKKDVKYELF